MSDKGKKPVYNKESQAKIGQTLVENNKKRNSISGEPPKKVGRVKIIPAHMAIFQNYKDQGFRSLGKAIRKTGVYSEGLANRVNALTKTKSWQTILDMYLPEEILAFRHAELLDKRDTETVYDEVPTGKKNKDGNIIYKKVARIVDKGPETNAVSKGLEMGYRLRGSFTKEEPKDKPTVYNLIYKPEIRQQIANFEEGIKQTLLNEINKRNIQEEKEEDNNGEDSGGDPEYVAGGDGADVPKIEGSE